MCCDALLVATTDGCVKWGGCKPSVDGREVEEAVERRREKKGAAKVEHAKSRRIPKKNNRRKQ